MRVIFLFTFGLLHILQHVSFISATKISGIFEDIPSTNISIPLYSIDNSYMAYIYIGTSMSSLDQETSNSAQKKLVIVDTGSKNLVLPCKPCKFCGKNHFSPYPYDMKESSTDITLKCYEGCTFPTSKECTKSFFSEKMNFHKCEFRQKYSEGSIIKGFEVNDWVWFGLPDERKSVDFYMQYGVFHTFGCQTKETGLIREQYADGVFGLGLLRLDNDYKKERKKEHVHFVKTMYQNRLVNHVAFSICLSKDAGILSLGGTSLRSNTDTLPDRNTLQNQPRHLEPMAFEPLRKSSYYKIKVKSFYVGDQKVDLHISIDDDEDDDDTDKSAENPFNDGRGTIIDSGTSESYFPKVVAEPFRDAWEKSMTRGDSAKEYDDDESHIYSFEDFTSLPNITIVLSHGYEWVIEPRYYLSTDEKDIDFERGWDGEIEFDFQIHFVESKGCVLGANAMIGHDILFDLSHQRVGIAKSIC